MSGLHALGSNGSGQLGLGHTEDVSVPKPVLFHPDNAPEPDDPITQIACGGNHTVLVTASGCAFISGNTTGLTFSQDIASSESSSASVSHFMPIPLPSHHSLPVISAACTWDATILILKDGSIWYFGPPGPLQMSLGISQDASTPGTPIRVPNFPPSETRIVCVAAGLAHVVAVMDNGSVYGWGNGRKGQLGTSEAESRGNPGKIEVGFPVVKAVCGQHFTCLFGKPGQGILAYLGPEKWELDKNAPASVLGWKNVSASWSGVYVLVEDGLLRAWGRDDHGQLPPPGFPRLKDIAAGSEHVVALTEDDDVIAWGWGEHGNCGPQTEGKFGDVKGRWNVIASARNLPEGSRLTTVGAGCATSWIYVHEDGIHL